MSCSARSFYPKTDTSSQDGKNSKISQEIDEKNQAIKKIKQELRMVNSINKSLNESCSILTAQAESCLEKINYEKNKFKNREAIFRNRKKELIELIAKKDKDLKSLESLREHMKYMLELREVAIDSAQKKFNTDNSNMTKSYHEAKTKEIQLERSLQFLQHEYSSTQTAIQKFELKEKSTEELLKTFYGIVNEKNDQILEEVLKQREMEMCEQSLCHTANHLIKEVSIMKYQIGDDSIHSIRECYSNFF